MAVPAHDLIIDLAIRYGFQVLGAIVILCAGFVLAWWIGGLVERPLPRLAPGPRPVRLTGRGGWGGRPRGGWGGGPPLLRLIVRVVRVVVLLFALVIALDKFGFQIAPLVAGIGVAGLGIGTALPGVLGNVIAGLTIIFTKPFRVGEHIEIVGMKGDVSTIELFSTTLLHPDRSRIIILNRKIVGEILHNFGTVRQIHLTVSVPHGSDLDLRPAPADPPRRRRAPRPRSRGGAGAGPGRGPRHPAGAAAACAGDRRRAD